MTDDFGSKLKEKFPLMCGNIRCGVSIGPGWQPVVLQALNQIQQLSPEARVAQIKEKFGGLRIYVDNIDVGSLSWDILTHASWAADLICEECGTTVNVSMRGRWLKTNCEDCHKKAGR